MLKIGCEAIGEGWRCHVTVDAAGEQTTHRVTVSRSDLLRWGGGREIGDVEDLLRRSFEFLLEREAAGSILQSFELSVIPRYFPEYDRLFRRTEGQVG